MHAEKQHAARHETLQRAVCSWSLGCFFIHNVVMYNLRLSLSLYVCVCVCVGVRTSELMLHMRADSSSLALLSPSTCSRRPLARASPLGQHAFFQAQGLTDIGALVCLEKGVHACAHVHPVHARHNAYTHTNNTTHANAHTHTHTQSTGGTMHGYRYLWQTDSRAFKKP